MSGEKRISQVPLREELERQGNWLFRRRAFLPLLGAPILALAFHQFSHPWGNPSLGLILDMVCLGISLVGLSIRVYVAGHTPKRTSGRNTAKGQIAHSLNTSGMYSIARHPLYLANFLVGLGPVLFFHSWWLILVYVSLFWVYYERIIFAEEEFLRTKFGDAYLEWCGRTPAFFPRFRSWRPPELPFCYRTALKREYQTLFHLVVVFTAIEVIGDLVVEGRFMVEPVWLIIFGLTLFFYLTVRILRKKTKILQVQGR
jgi:protein-S-isoprenylcysteine O-methyltransferase Ste14